MQEQKPTFNYTLRDLLNLPIGFLLNLSPLWAFTLLVMVLSLCGVLYYSLNSDFFGLAAPPFADFKFSNNYQVVTDKDGRKWKIEFEKSTISTFTGVVRDVVHWRDEPEIPFATHDILITTGEYSSPKRVTTRVQEHAVYYQWYYDPLPTGHINLLHIVPVNEDIYHQLLAVRDWNLVSITGREILRIIAFDKNGLSQFVFQDQGCNSILVTAVQIKAQGTPIP